MIEKARRLFIFEWETISDSLSRFNKNNIEDEDFFLVFQRNNITIKDVVQSTINMLKKMEIVNVCSCEELDNKSFKPFALAKIEKFCDEKTNIYFIKSENTYELVKNDIEGKYAGIHHKVSFSYVKHNNFTSEREKKDAKELGDMSSAFNDNPQPNKTNRENRTNREYEEYRKIKEEEKKEPVNNKNATIKELEKKIFSEAKVDQQISEEYTELDDNKAKMLISTLERFKKHVNLAIENEDELNEDDYSKLIIQLIKSPNEDDFKKSIEITNLKAKIRTNKENFIIFKKEAEYYIKMCDLFFKEDKF